MTTNCNVVFIIIDALRARNLSCYGYPKQTTPNIDALARKGVLFEDAFSCTNSTDSSLTSIFSGKYPINHGIVGHGMRLGEEQLKRIAGISFLHEILKSHGYVTLAVDWLKRWHERNYDVYYDPYHGQRDPHGIYKRVTSTYKILKHIGVILRFLKMGRIYRKGRRMLNYGCEAEGITNIAVKLIEDNPSSNFFIFLHYWDTHTQTVKSDTSMLYNSPRPYAEKFYRHRENSDDQSIEEMISQIQNERRRAYLMKLIGEAPNMDYVLAQYDGAIAHVDHEVGKLIDFIESNNMSDETLIVLTSDHGESLTEHGIFFDHHGLYDVSIHVPLVLKGPGLPEGKKIRGLVQHVDVVPTILDILNIPISDKKAFDGRSLLPLIKGEEKQVHSAIFVEEAYYQRKRAVRTSRHKYIRALSKETAMCRCCQSIHGGLEELYDLSKDPQETQNIVKEEPEVKKKLRKTLSRWTESFKHVEMEEKLEERYAPSSEEEKEVMERLRKLGYF